MFDLERMKKAVEGENFRVPSGLSLEQMHFLFLLPEETHRDLQFLTDENMKSTIRELMLEKKVWDSEILETGGVGYYKPSYSEEILTSGGDVYKPRYRVAKTSKECDKLLKFRIKTADGEIFSVTSKTQAEAQFVVDDIFGKGHYRVSRMLY